MHKTTLATRIPSNPLHSLAEWLVGTLVLTWVMVLNGSPILFYDSEGYLRFGEAIWTYLNRVGTDPDLLIGATGSGSGGDGDGALMGGRSYAYGAMAWAARLGLGYWFVVLVQAAAVSGTVLFALRRMGVETRGVRLVILATLSLLTPLAFFVATIMPDVFAAFSPLSVVLLIVFWAEMKVSERVFWGAALLSAIMFHTAFLALAIPVFLLSVLVACYRRWPFRSASLFIVSILGAGLALEAVSIQTAERVSGQTMVAPPFILARTIADGPMAEILIEDCAATGNTRWQSCRIVDQLPTTEIEILWTDRGWGGLSAEERNAVSSEQLPLMVELVRRKPVEQFMKSCTNAAAQVFESSILEFVSAGIALQVANAPDRASIEAYLDSRIATGRFPALLLDRLWLATYLGSMVVAFALLVSGRQWKASADPRLPTVLTLLLLSVLFSAAITGPLSGVFGRYQARIGWLALLVVCVIVAHGAPIWRSWRRSRNLQEDPA
jgi:hypothetical protein